MYINTQNNLNVQQIYSLFVGAVVPRPIAWVSSLNLSGVVNLAPFSFFTVASINPPVLAISVLNPNNKTYKDTLYNLQQTGECVINIVSVNLAEQMNASCADYAADISEFEQLDIAQTHSEMVKVPSVAQSKVRFECTLNQVIQVSNQPMGGNLILLNVVGIFINDSVLTNNQINPALLQAVGKMGGNVYNHAQVNFELQRPQL